MNVKLALTSQETTLKCLGVINLFESSFGTVNTWEDGEDTMTTAGSYLGRQSNRTSAAPERGKANKV